MATIFESRPRLTSVAKPRVDEGAVSGALAALEAATRQVMEVTAACPLEQERAADLLTSHARRLREASTHMLTGT